MYIYIHCAMLYIRSTETSFILLYAASNILASWSSELFCVLHGGGQGCSSSFTFLLYAVPCSHSVSY